MNTRRSYWLGWVCLGFIMGTLPTAGLAGEKQYGNVLGLNWSAAFGSGTYATPTQSENVALNGFVAEMEKGIELFTAKGLSFVVAPSFLILAGTNHFNVAIAGPVPFTQAWATKATFLGTMIQAKYRYTFPVGPVEVGLHNGFAFGYFLERLDWSWSDPNDANNLASGSVRADGFAPAAELGLTLSLAVTEISRLGLGLTAMLTPFDAGGYTIPLVAKAGLNYQVTF